MAITPEGVSDVSILAEAVPPPIVGCIATPMWDATWPAPDEPTELTLPFAFTAVGSGSAPGATDADAAASP